MTPSWLKYICVIIACISNYQGGYYEKIYFESSIALAVAGVFGATVAVTAAEQATPVPVTQEVAATAAPVAEPATHQVVPTIQVYSSS